MEESWLFGGLNIAIQLRLMSQQGTVLSGGAVPSISPCFEQGPLGVVGKAEAVWSRLPVQGDSAASCEPAVCQLHVGHTAVTASGHGENWIVVGR